jgi:hypothetical protein
VNIAIQQPEHIPWVGFFNKMAQCDLFVYLDNVQFKKRYFENRNKISGKAETIWLTVPVASKGLYTQKLCDVQIDNGQVWQKKYKGRLEHVYGKYPFWSDLKELVFPHLDKSFDKLVDLNITLIDDIRKYLKIDTPTTLASKVISEDLKGSDLILEICFRSKASLYTSGPDGLNYLESEKFLKNGIEIVYHNFQHPEYPQMREVFTSNLSILDLIANCGERSSDFINACVREDIENAS